MIVDDDTRNTFALCSYLETLGITIETAANGEQALNLLAQPPMPDIILLDMMMPVMDGYETLQAMQQKQELKTIPVVALTARAMKGDREKCMEAGAWDYISKPVDMRLLVQTLEKWITKNGV